MGEHGVEFAWRAWEKEEVGRKGGIGATDWGKVETWGGAVIILENRGGEGSLGLALDAGGGGEAPAGEVGFDGNEDEGIEDEIEAEPSGDEVAGEVIGSGAEATSDENDF